MKKREMLPPKARLGLRCLHVDYDEVVRLRLAVQAAESELAIKSDSRSRPDHARQHQPRSKADDR
jgi:hypothetical protein